MNTWRVKCRFLRVYVLGYYCVRQIGRESADVYFFFVLLILTHHFVIRCVYWGPFATDKIDAWTECCCILPKTPSCVTTPVLWTTHVSLDAARTTICATVIWNQYCTSATPQVTTIGWSCVFVIFSSPLLLRIYRKISYKMVSLFGLGFLPLFSFFMFIFWVGAFLFISLDCQTFVGWCLVFWVYSFFWFLII